MAGRGTGSAAHLPRSRTSKKPLSRALQGRAGLGKGLSEGIQANVPSVHVIQAIIDSVAISAALTQHDYPRINGEGYSGQAGRDPEGHSVVGTGRERS